MNPPLSGCWGCNTRPQVIHRTLAQVLEDFKGLDMRPSCRVYPARPAVDCKDIPHHEAYFNVFFSPIILGQGVRGAVVLLSDITEEKILQRSRDDFFSIAPMNCARPSPPSVQRQFDQGVLLGQDQKTRV